MENPIENSDSSVEITVKGLTDSISDSFNFQEEPEVKEEKTIDTPGDPIEEPAEEIETDDDGGGNEEHFEPAPDNNNDDETPWQVIANEFRGSILDDSDFESEDFKFDGTKESFTEMISRRTEREAEKMVDDLIENLPDKLKNPIKNYIDGLDLDDAFEVSDKLSKYENITREKLTENLDLAKQIYKDDLIKNKGFSKEKAEKWVQRAEDLDELVDEALDSSKEFSAKIKAEKESKKAAQAEEAKLRAEKAAQKIENLKKEIMESKELFKGIPTTDIIKKKVYENMTKPVGNDANGKPLTKIQMLAQKNPEEFFKLLNTYEVLGLFEQDKNGKFIPKLDKLTTYKKSNIIDSETDKLRQAANRFKGGSSNTSFDSKSLKDNLDTIKKAFESSES